MEVAATQAAELVVTMAELVPELEAMARLDTVVDLAALDHTLVVPNPMEETPSLAASQDPQDPLEDQELQEDQDAQEPMECQEPLDDLPEVLATHLPHPHHASLAQEAHQDHQDTPDPRESQAKLEPQDKASVVLHQARQDQRDPLELLEIPEAMDSPEIPASLHRAKAAVLLLQALQDHLEIRDHLDLPDHQDKAELEFLDQRDHLEHLECPDQTETPELLASLETLVERASVVSVRLTAPTTVVCSSRMER